MQQKRLSISRKVPMTIAALVLCFVAYSAIKNSLFILHKKEAIGRVINYKVPDPQHPTTYIVETRFFNEYKHDSAALNVRLENYSDNVPTHITLHYDDNSEVYAGQQQVTWGTVMWKSLVCLLLLSYIAMELTTFTIGK